MKVWCILRIMTRLKRILIGQNPRRTLVRILIISTVCLVVFGLIARPVKVKGISMEPTLRNGSIHFVNLLTYRYADPVRGDLVAVVMPGRNAYFVKRVLGLPGERLSFQNGHLFINDVSMVEPYIIDRGNWTLDTVVIPAGSYFIAGDNRLTSFISHTLGFVDRKNISGKLLQ